LKASGNEGSEVYTKLEKEIAVAEQKLKTLGTTAAQTSKSFTEKMAEFGLAAQGVQQITSAFEKFLVPYQEFDKQLRNIGTLGVKNFEEFREAPIDIAVKVPDTVAGVTEGIYNAISAGAIKVVNGVADIEVGMKFVEQASKLAVAGLTDTNSAIKSLAANLNAYGVSTEQAERFSDILFNTVNNGVTTIPELNASLSNVIPTAASFGVAFEQVSAAIATMTQHGVPTAQATTQIRAALVELAKPGVALAPIMQKAGVSLESLQKEGFQISMKKLGEAMEEAGLRANQVFSSVEAAGAALALSGKNADKYANILNTYSTDAIGSTQRAFDIANEGIGVKIQGILNQIKASFFKFFNFVGDSFTSVLSLSNQIAPMVMTFGQLGNMLPIDKIKGQLSGISSGFIGLIKNAENTGGVLKGLSLKMQDSGGILAKLGPAITNPWVLGIGAAVAGLTLFLTQTDKGSAILERLGDIAEDIFQKAQPAINGFLEMGEEVIDYLMVLGEYFYELLITPIEISISIISEIINGLLSFAGVSDTSANAFNNLGDVFKFVGKIIGTVADTFQMVIYAIRIAKEYVIGFISAVPELFSVFLDMPSIT
jgi:TP901 family phage tail tape measure protein